MTQAVSLHVFSSFLNPLQSRTIPHLSIISQIILLLCRPCVLIHMPFDVTALLCQCATTNFEQAHRHPGPHLGQLDRLPARADKDVMPHFDAVGQVLKRHDPATDFLIRGRSFARGKQMLQDLHHTFAQRGVEVVEYEMRIGFRDCSARRRGQVVAEENVVEGKRRRGAVRQM